VPHTASPLNTLLPILIVFAIVAVRMSRMTGVRPMRLSSLWIRPAIFTVLAAMLVYNAPPQGLEQYLILLATLVIGALLGWHQAKLMAISVDTASGTLQVKASVWAILVFLAVILLRLGLRTWLLGTDSPLHAYLGVITDAFLLFIVGFYGARAAEMFIRGRALLAAHGQSGQPG
jgi:hypothetical protein